MIVEGKNMMIIDVNYFIKIISKLIYMSEYFDFQKLEKNSIEELQTQFFELEDEIDKLTGIIDDAKTKKDNKQCIQWNIMEIIRKKKKSSLI